MKGIPMEQFRWRMAKWLWAPPGETPLSDPGAAEWFKPSGRPVKNKRWHLYRDGRGAKAKAPLRIDEFYMRGSRSQHEISKHNKPKAVLDYRGKGAKVERRSKKSIARRKGR